MGWNTVSIRRENPLLYPEDRQRFSLIHSTIICADDADVVATCSMGMFVAAFAHGNIFGMQFTRRRVTASAWP
ncbi:hypothetical protein MASR1M66_22470 [Aminivibrio sp.]